MILGKFIRLASGRWGRLVVLGFFAGAALACSPAARFKVLDLLFDGVPGGRPARKPAPPPVDLASRSSLSPRRPAATPRPAPLPVVSTHKPVAEHKCGECHSSGGGYVPIQLDERLCDKCHREKRVREGWNHGPINLGTCIPCHRAHESPYPHLLDKPIPELCLQCHEGTLESKAKYHQVANLKQCLKCHDPHWMY